MSLIVGGEIFERAAAVFMARVLDATGAVIVQGDVSTIKYEIWDVSASPEPSEIVDSTSLVVADTVYNALQVDAAWTAAGGDATGYNFRAVLADTNFDNFTALTLNSYPTPRRAAVGFEFVMVSGDVFHLEFETKLRHVLYGKT